MPVAKERAAHVRRIRLEISGEIDKARFAEILQAEQRIHAEPASPSRPLDRGRGDERHGTKE